MQEFKEAPKSSFVVVLDNIRSQSNTGSIFRTCDAFKVNKLFLCGITATPPHREIEKTALGATQSVDWAYYEQTADCISHLKKSGFYIVAIEQAEPKMLLGTFTFEKEKKIALVFGNELNGVDEAVMAIADACIEIPQFGTKHSLNVAVSAGIVIWELSKSQFE